MWHAVITELQKVSRGGVRLYTRLIFDTPPCIQLESAMLKVYCMVICEKDGSCKAWQIILKGVIISISPNHGPKNGSPTGLKICDCLYTSLSLGSYFFISLLWYIPLAVGCICLGIKWVVDGRKISWFEISSFFPQAKIVYQFSSDMKACFLFFTVLVLNPSHILWLFVMV